MTPPLAVRRLVPDLRVRIGVVALIAAVAGTLAGSAPTADAATAAFGVTVTGETALVREDGGLQTTIVGLTVAPAEGASAREAARPVVVLPVPATTEASEVEGTEAQVFGELFAATRPRTVASETARQNGDDAALRVPDDRFADVEQQAFEPRDAAGLVRWLRARGHRPASATVRALDAYARDGWGFVALALDGPVTGDEMLRPLRLEFGSDRLRYPLRPLQPDAAPPTLRIYVAGPHRVTVDEFDTYHAGWVVDLDPSPRPEVQALLGGQEYLTKLGRDDHPTGAGTVLRAEQGVSDRLFRSSADYPREESDAFATAPLPDENVPEVPFDGPPGWLWLVLLAGVVALVAVVGLALRWRSARPR